MRKALIRYTRRRLTGLQSLLLSKIQYFINPKLFITTSESYFVGGIENAIVRRCFKKEENYW